MNYLTKNLKQTAVYWGNPQPDGFGGYDFDDPVEINVRWVDKQKLFRDAAGKERVSQSVVLTSQDVDKGGFLHLGTLDDVSSSTAGPEDVDNSFQILGFDKIPDIKARYFLRKAYL